MLVEVWVDAGFLVVSSVVESDLVDSVSDSVEELMSVVSVSDELVLVELGVVVVLLEDVVVVLVAEVELSSSTSELVSLVSLVSDTVRVEVAVEVEEGEADVVEDAASSSSMVVVAVTVVDVSIADAG